MVTSEISDNTRSLMSTGFPLGLDKEMETVMTLFCYIKKVSSSGRDDSSFHCNTFPCCPHLTKYVCAEMLYKYTQVSFFLLLLWEFCCSALQKYSLAEKQFSKWNPYSRFNYIQYGSTYFKWAPQWLSLNYFVCFAQGSFPVTEKKWTVRN